MAWTTTRAPVIASQKRRHVSQSGKRRTDTQKGTYHASQHAAYHREPDHSSGSAIPSSVSALRAAWRKSLGGGLGTTHTLSCRWHGRGRGHLHDQPSTGRRKYLGHDRP